MTLMALLKLVMKFCHIFALAAGWFAVAAILLLLILLAWDKRNNSQAIKKIYLFCRSILQKENDDKPSCPVCNPENRSTLPSEHVFCYACGKHLEVIAAAAE